MRNNLKSYLIVVLSVAAFTGCPKNAERGAIDIYAEADVVANMEKEYLSAKKNNDFEKAYSFQHPIFKSIISLPEYIEKKGKILMNMSKVDSAYPLPAKYVISGFPSRTVDYQIKKICISKNGRYAKAETILLENVIFPIPAPGPINIRIKTIDYWEKLSGRWYLLSKKRISAEMHISGNITNLKEERMILFPEENAEYEEIILDDTK